MDDNLVTHQIETMRTADIFFAAFLKTAAVPLYDVRKEDGRVNFYFEKTPGIDDLKRSYFNRKGKIVAMDFADEYRALKTLTYELM